MKYKLYVTVNKLNGKLYGGKRYWTPGTCYMGSGIALKKAIEKYGAENFEVRWFKLRINTPIDLERLEIKLIRRLRYKFGRDRCYNMAKGGRGGCYRSDADDERKKEVGELVSKGKRKQYANGETEAQIMGRIKASETKKNKFKDPTFYDKFINEYTPKRVNSLQQRLLKNGRTDKEKKFHKRLIKYSLVDVTYKIVYPDALELIETNTLQDFQKKYITQDNVFSYIRKNGSMTFMQKINVSKHLFPTGTRLIYLSESRRIDKNEEAEGSSVPSASIDS